MTTSSRPWILPARPGMPGSARAGTWPAPVGAIVIAALMATCAWYACAALDLVRRPPWLRTGLAVMAAICLLRAAALPALAVTHPELRNTFEVVAAIVWGLAGAGAGFVLGYAAVRRRLY